METRLQQRQQNLTAQGRFAATIPTVHDNGHEDASWMDPWFVGIGGLLEGLLEAAHEEGNALELLFVTQTL